MNKTYYKPETRFVNLMNPYSFLSGSNTNVTPDVGAGDGEHGTLGSRNAFWEDFDEDLLEDMDKEDLKDLK